MIFDLHQLPEQAEEPQIQMKDCTLALLYLDDFSVALFVKKDALVRSMKDARAKVRPFAVLKKCDCNGRTIWKIQETHYLAKV